MEDSRGRVEAQLRLTFHGTAVENGRMGVLQGAPALVALARLLEESQSELFPDAGPVQVEVAVPVEGSFEWLIVVTGLATTMFASDPATAASNLHSLLAATGDLLKFIKNVGGRALGERTTTGSTVEFVLDNRETLREKESTIQLFDRVTIRRHAREVVRPLADPGYSKLRFLAPHREPVEINSDEWPAFVYGSEDPSVTESEYVEMLRVDQVALVPDLRWRFHNGETRFPAAVEDENFLARVAQNQEAFRAGDVLVARVRVRQELKSDGKLTVSRSVREVLEHRPAHSQTTLDLDD